MPTVKQKTKRKTGRPSKRSKEVEETLFRALRSGVANESACYIAGIDPETAARWKRSDSGFAAAVKKSKAHARAKLAATMFERATTGGDTTAAIWWMKCQDPEFRESKDKHLSVPGLGEVRDQSGIASAVLAAVNQVIDGQASPAALRDFVASLEAASALIERSEIDERLKKVEAALTVKV